MTTHHSHRIGQTPSLIERYTELLRREGLEFEVDEDARTIGLFVETEAGVCEGYIIVESLEAVQEDGEEPLAPLDFCEVAFILPLEEALDAADKLAFYELLLRLNESHRIGSYELNFEDRELRFRIYQTHPTDQRIAPEHLLMPIYEAIQAINQQWVAIRMVLEEGVDATHAMGEYFAGLALDPEDGLEEEMLGRANEMYELARERYAKRGEEEHLAFLEQRLKRLSAEAGRLLIRQAVAEA